MRSTSTGKQWTYRLRRRPGRERSGTLALRWEVHSDPISDDYLPSEIDAATRA
jgi:hypothetical protein